MSFLSYFKVPAQLTSFDYIAPRNWNSLPDIVRLAPSVPTFRKRLKTYLFWQAFSPPYNTLFLLAGSLGL